MSWPMVRFGDVAQIVTGSTPKAFDENFDGDIPFVTPGDLGEVADIHQAKRSLSALGAASVRTVPKRSVMVCCIGATIGKVGFAARDVATNQQINTLVFDEKIIFPKYAYYYCLTIKSLLVSKSSSTTMPIVNKSNFSDLKMPVPFLGLPAKSLAEQKRIAAILDKADAIRRKRQKAIQLADDFLRSVFLDMFGDPVTNPKGFTKVVLGDVCTIKGGKRIPKGDNLVKENTGFPYIKAGNIKNGKVTTKNLEYVPNHVREKIQRYTVVEGDICLTVVGANIGDVGIVPKELNNASLTENANKLLVQDKQTLLNFYLASALQMDFIQNQIKSKTMAVGVPKLALFRIEQLELLIPPVVLQKKFEDKVNKIDSLIDKVKGGVFFVNEQFNSLSQKAFAGEL